MEDWQNAIKLETFIRYHTPKGYREPIHRFDFVPYVNATDYTAIKQAYDNGTLQSFLETYQRQIFDYAIYPFNKPYIIDAIKTYFNRETKPQLAILTCQWCDKTFTHEKIYPEDMGKYKQGGAVFCPHCGRFTNPNPKYHGGKLNDTAKTD